MDRRRLAENLTTLAPFIGQIQQAAIVDGLNGEEAEHFAEVMERLAEIVRSMPQTYETDGQGEEAVAHLHYFGASHDFYITEKDKGDSNEHIKNPNQWQAFGYTVTPHGKEAGYICLPELFKAGIELDFYWTPKTVKEATR